MTRTNAELLAAARRFGLSAEWLPPGTADQRLAPGDTVLARLDVRPTLDGVENGVSELRRAQRSGVRVLNDPRSLLRSHDKLATALALRNASVPHPPTVHVREPGPTPPLRPPVVLKPRFGSWGMDVSVCPSRSDYVRALDTVRKRAWFRNGILVQQLVPPPRSDLRVVVAGGRAVGAIERHAAPGEWRTNVALGARRCPAKPSPRAVELALAAAGAVGGDLVGIDLLPLTGGDYTVLEVNGAVDFTGDYSLGGRDVFEAVVEAIAPAAGRTSESRRQLLAGACR
jgi:RimK family alpha-L-glutamate ligase